jgi:hypothetical protein
MYSEEGLHAGSTPGDANEKLTCFVLADAKNGVA